MYQSKYNQFIFEDYSFNKKDKKLKLNYSYDGLLKFTEEYVFDFDFTDAICDEVLDNAFRGLFLCAGMSYFKSYLASKIIVKKFDLTKYQAEFFNKLYLLALGQFFYENKIDPGGLINFPYRKGAKSNAQRVKKLEGALVPFGGGKDSIVSSEILKNSDINFDLFTISFNRAFDSLADNYKSDRVRVYRKISSNLLSLNKKDALNGHVSVTSIISFVALVSTIFRGRKDIVLSNEKSSSEENTNFFGIKINHQFSKSIEFEKDIQKYIEKEITPSIRYFSLLRPLSEIRIAELFSKKLIGKYGHSFVSCNVNWKLTNKTEDITWCGNCPKCAFVYAIFSPFMKKNDLKSIFKSNFFEKKSLRKTYDELMGIKGIKPFECVGEINEVNHALYMAKKTGNYPELNNFKIKKSYYDYFAFGSHLMPRKYEKALINYLRFSLPKNILIYGYGIEGESSYKYLKKKYFGSKISIYDDFLKKYDKCPNFLNYDMVVVTPGISPKKTKNIGNFITTNSQLFFDELDDNLRKRVIGVTGTKGKSTTVKFINEVINSSGSKSVIGGNFGIPILDHLERFKEGKIDYVVAEFSSYQLNRLKSSPGKAIYLNIYRDHLDWHKDMDDYGNSKSIIFKYQSGDDLLIVPEVHLKSIKNLPEQVIFSKKAHKNYFSKGSHFRADFNLDNFGAAVDLLTRIGIKKKLIKSVAKDFQGLSHRFNCFGIFKGINFIDDAISTNPDSTLAGVLFLENSLGSIILGGADRGQDFRLLVKELARLNVFIVVIKSAVSDVITNEIKKIGYKRLQEAKNMRSAVKLIYCNTESGKYSMLSTAAPSYGLYRNYIEQGADYKRLVIDLAKE